MDTMEDAMEQNTNALPPLFGNEPLLWGDGQDDTGSQENENKESLQDAPEIASARQDNDAPAGEGMLEGSNTPLSPIDRSTAGNGETGKTVRPDNHSSVNTGSNRNEDEDAAAEVDALFESVKKKTPEKEPVSDSEDDGANQESPATVPMAPGLEQSSLPEINYTVKDVAVRLGTTPQTIRNYSDSFDSILHVRRGESGQRLYTEETIRMISTIIECKNTRKMSDDEVKAYFGVSVVRDTEKDTNSEAPGSPLKGQDVEKIAALVTESVQERIKAFFEIGLADINKKMDQLTNSSARLSEIVLLQEKQLEKLSEGNTSISTSVETLSASQNEGLTEIMSLLEKLTTQTSEGSPSEAKENEEVLEKAKVTIKNLAKELTVKDNMITALMEEVRLTQQKLESSQEKKEKPGTNNFPYNDVQDKKPEEPPKKKKRFWFF